MVGKPRSCTACRQAKTACDAKTKAPDPCSRCRINKFECYFNEKFKRVATRQIAREIANDNLRLTQNQDAADSSLLNHQLPTPSAPTVSPRWLLSTNVENSNFVLGNISLTAEVAVELLRHFERYYYPYATFLEPEQSLGCLASESPPLFWTIVLIASQHHEKYNHLYKDLFYPHSQLLANILNTAIRSLRKIHVLLLLCLWPIPRRRILLNPSWTYMGIAVNSCLMLNCHNPLSGNLDVPRLFNLSRHIDVRTQCLTWLACFAIGTRMATFCGFVPPTSSSSHLKYVRKAVEQLGSSLPLFHRASLVIDETICNYSITLEHTDNEEAHFSLTNIFDANLDAVKQTYAANWNPDLDVHLHLAKLNLYALSSLLPSATDSQVESQALINKRTLFLRGLDSAIALIDTIKGFAVFPEREESQLQAQVKLAFLPKHFFTGLFFAAIFLFRLFVWSPQQPLNNMNSARAIQAMLDAMEVFQCIPNHRDYARAARLIKKLLEIAQQRDTDSQPSLEDMVVTNRLGASLLWDTFARIHASAVSNGNGKDVQSERLIGPEPLPPSPDMNCSLESQHGLELNGALPTNQEEEEAWTTQNISLDDFGFGFDVQMLWEV